MFLSYKIDLLKLQQSHKIRFLFWSKYKYLLKNQLLKTENEVNSFMK